MAYPVIFVNNFCCIAKPIVRHFELRVLVKQNCNTFSKRSSQAFLPRSKTVIKRMRSDGIVPKQNIILNVGGQFILATVWMLINELAFQSVEVTLHRSVVIRATGTAHALSYIVSWTIVGEFPWSILRTLVAAQNNAVFQYPWVLTYCLGKSPDFKLGCNNSSADARNNTSQIFSCFRQ